VNLFIFYTLLHFCQLRNQWKQGDGSDQCKPSSGAFDFITFNANKGHIDMWHPPSTTALAAAPSGTTFDLYIITSNLWANRDERDTGFWQIGWFTAPEGGTLIDYENRAFNGAGLTFYAQWESYPKGTVTEEWIPPPNFEQVIEQAAAGSGVVTINMAANPALTTADIPISALLQIDSNEADLKTSIVMPQGTMTLNPSALASLLDQVEGDMLEVTIQKMSLTDHAHLSDEQKAIVGSSPIIRIEIHDNLGNEIKDFGNGEIEITLPWEGAFPAFIYWLRDDGIPVRMRGHYNATSRLVTFISTHLSLYTIRHVPSGGSAPQTGDYRSVAIPIILISLGTLVIMSWKFNDKRIKKAGK